VKEVLAYNRTDAGHHARVGMDVELVEATTKGKHVKSPPNNRVSKAQD